MALDENVKRELLPPGYPPIRHSPSSFITPAARAVAKEVGDHGWKKLDKIEKDYQSQITAWKSAFSEVISAYATAVNRRDLTLEEAKREREAEAAAAAFILGLLTGGAMRFLGAWMQYTVVPGFKVKSRFPTWDFSKKGPGIAGRLTFAIKPVERFSKLQASAFGGIAQDIGNKTLASLFPEPKPVAYKLDSWSGVDNLRTDFDKFVTASAKPVLDQFQAVKDWMEDELEFGLTWGAYSAADVDRAQSAVRGRLKELRDKWAGQWELFGTSPRPIDRAALADAYERSLWADHLLAVIGKAMEEASLPRHKPSTGNFDPGHWFVDDLIEKAIVRRLRQLNVVWADTEAEGTAQMTRIGEGAPKPQLEVHNALDFEYEARWAMDWAEGFLKGAPELTARRFFSSGSKRTLPAI